MKKLFYLGLLGLAVFEVLKVYFIMPMPGSQEINSLGLAYFLHSYRWFFRLFFCLLIVIGCFEAFEGGRKWIPSLVSIFVLAIIYQFNFIMSADSMFKDPQNPVFKSFEENLVNDSSLVIGVEWNGEAKAYPLRYLAYHHKVVDQINDKPIMVTYCNVCRSGRVFEPVVNGKIEDFRLVGMDHFNAMFEDASTKSWWQQATGEAIAGPLKGKVLPEITSVQLTLNKFFELHPKALVMQADEASISKYDSLAKFEKGLSTGKLTKTDTLSWFNKSWVVGIQIGELNKAYDWNDLIEQRIIHDKIRDIPIVLVLSNDGQSFAAFERPDENIFFSNENDTLISNSISYDFTGKALQNHAQPLKLLNAYQEFWHSWKTFHPQTEKYIFNSK